MLVFGGTNGKEEEELVWYEDWYLLDTQTSTWREITNVFGLPVQARDSFSMVAINDFVYIFGGQGRSVGNDDVFLSDFIKVKVMRVGARVIGNPSLPFQDKHPRWWS